MNFILQGNASVLSGIGEISTLLRPAVVNNYGFRVDGTTDSTYIGALDSGGGSRFTVNANTRTFTFSDDYVGGNPIIKLQNGSTFTPTTAAAGNGIGTAALPFSSYFLGAAATNNIQLTGTATAARTATFPDASGTVMLGTGLTPTVMPYAVTAGTLGDTGAFWTGTAYRWHNAAFSTNWRMDFTPNDTTGVFHVGDSSGGEKNRIALDQNAGTLVGIGLTSAEIRGGNAGTTYFHVDSSGVLQCIGATSAILQAPTANVGGVNISLQLTSSNRTFTFYDASALGICDFAGVKSFKAYRTITAAATTGNQTIERGFGTINIAAAGTTVTLTNADITANSLIFPVLRTNDTTAKGVVVVAGAGSAVFTLNDAATAEVSIGFLVTN